MTCTCLARSPIAQADRLTAIADALVPPVDVAKEDEAARKIDVEEAEAALKTALAAIEESNTTMGSAAAKTSDARQRVGETEAAVLECRIAVRKLGATGAGTGEEEPPNMDDLPGPDDGGAAGVLPDDDGAAGGDGLYAARKRETSSSDIPSLRIRFATA